MPRSSVFSPALLCRLAPALLLALAACQSNTDDGAWNEQTEAANAQARAELANTMAEVARLEELARLGLLANATDDFGNDSDLNALDATATPPANAAELDPAADIAAEPVEAPPPAPPPPAAPPSQEQLRSADEAVAAAMRKARER